MVMPVIDAWRRYRALNTRQKRFLRTKGATLHMTIPKVIKLLKPIAEFDQRLDRIVSTLTLTYSILLGAGFVSLFFGLFAQIPSLVGFAGPAIGGGAIVYIISRIASRNDTNNNVRNFVVPLLEILYLEVGPKQRINLKLNFDKALKKTNRKRLARRPRANVKSEEHFEFGLLTLDCKFLDGTKCRLTVTDRIRRRTQGRKGKVKVKLKRRTDVRLGFHRMTYALDPDAVIPDGVDRRFSDAGDGVVYKYRIKEQNANMSTTRKMDISKFVRELKVPYNFLTIEGVDRAAV
jgi:hypothetical protein